jgi:hypothetical protein
MLRLNLPPVIRSSTIVNTGTSKRDETHTVLSNTWNGTWPISGRLDELGR